MVIFLCSGKHLQITLLLLGILILLMYECFIMRWNNEVKQRKLKRKAKKIKHRLTNENLHIIISDSVLKIKIIINHYRVN